MAAELRSDSVRSFWKQNWVHLIWGLLVAIFLAGQIWAKFKETSEKADQSLKSINDINITLGRYDELLKGQQKINEENARMFSFLIARIRSGR